MLKRKAAQKAVFKRISLESDSDSDSNDDEGDDREDESDRSLSPPPTFPNNFEEQIKTLQNQVSRLHESKSFSRS